MLDFSGLTKRNRISRPIELKLEERHCNYQILVGIGIIVTTIIVFTWNESRLFSTSDRINSEKIGHFGDIVGGLVGYTWSLAGIILFYVALIEQRKDIQTNRVTLSNQVKALNNK